MMLVEFDPKHTVYGGCDLSSKVDLTSFCMVQENEEGGWNANWLYWIPQQRAEKGTRDDSVPYNIWEEQGYLRYTRGTSIDHDQIREDISNVCAAENIDTIGFDPWNAQWLESQLERDGIDCVEVRQGYASLSEPCKTLEACVKEGTFRHGSNPITNWCAENVEVQVDANENMRPIKGGDSKKRIDGIVASLIAMAVAIELGDRGNLKSVYNEPGSLWE